MTVIGKRLCRKKLYWEVVESDYERMVRLHQGDVYLRHTALCLQCAHKARKAGYAVELVPEIPIQCEDNIPLIHYQPDLLIWNDIEYFYVEAEMQSRKKKAKWIQQEKIQGNVTFYSSTTLRKDSLVKEIGALGIRNVIGLD